MSFDVFLKFTVSFQADWVYHLGEPAQDLSVVTHSNAAPSIVILGELKITLREIVINLYRQLRARRALMMLTMFC